MSKVGTFSVCAPTWQEIDKAFKDANCDYRYDIDPYDPLCFDNPPDGDFQWFVDVDPRNADKACKVLEAFDGPIYYEVNSEHGRYIKRK